MYQAGARANYCLFHDEGATIGKPSAFLTISTYTRKSRGNKLQKRSDFDRAVSRNGVCFVDSFYVEV